MRIVDLQLTVALVSSAVLGSLHAAESAPPFLFTFGASGVGDGELGGPGALAVASSGNVYISEVSNRRIQAFAPNGEYALRWGMLSPGGIAIDGTDNVFVIDKGFRTVTRFDLAGTKIMEWGRRGTEDGQFTSPSNVAVDASGSVYVTDFDTDRVQKFDGSGNFLLKWGSRGTEDGQFWWTGGIAVGTVGRVYVSDMGNRRIQVFDTDGNYIGKWGEEGSGDGQFSSPGAVATDPFGNVYVADTQIIRIQKFDGNGNFLTKWDVSGAYNAGGIAATSSRVYVSDTTGNKVYVYGTQDTTEEPSLEIVQLDAANMRISWSPATPGFALQSASDPNSTTWSPVPDGDTAPVTVPVEGRGQFFRLLKP